VEEKGLGKVRGGGEAGAQHLQGLWATVETSPLVKYSFTMEEIC
jgi:hypothetical protein